MFYVISLQASTFYPYWILTYVFLLLTWRFLMDFESLVCWGNHWVHKFLGFSVNKAAQKINLSSNIMGKKNQSWSNKEHVSVSQLPLTFLSTHQRSLNFEGIMFCGVFFFPQLTAVPVWWFTVCGCLSGKARHILTLVTRMLSSSWNGKKSNLKQANKFQKTKTKQEKQEIAFEQEDHRVCLCKQDYSEADVKEYR